MTSYTDLEAMDDELADRIADAREAEVCVCRWGGGASHGMYHAFLTGAGYSFFTFSRQCVVDDFGDLVPVDGGGT